MTSFGCTLMTEQSGPKQLVGYAVDAERLGFDFEVMSDHYFPWLDEMGHAPYAWSVLGAVAHATERVELMPYVTCPTIRCHPALVAQEAATVGVLSDHLVSTEPEAELVSEWAGVRSAHGLPRSRSIGQVAICWGTDRATQVGVAHDTFRWFAGGWHVNVDLPTPAGLSAATQFVRPDDVAAAIPCGPDLDAIVEAVRPFWDAGFSDVALVQVGDRNQQEFLDTAAGPLLERLRAAGPGTLS